MDSLYSFLFYFLAHLLSFDIVDIYSLVSKFLNTLNLPSPKYNTGFEREAERQGGGWHVDLERAVFAGGLKGCEILYQMLEKQRGDPNSLTNIVASRTLPCCIRRRVKADVAQEEDRPGCSEMTFEI